MITLSGLTLLMVGVAYEIMLVAVDPEKERTIPKPFSIHFDSSLPLILDPWLSDRITVFCPFPVILAYELFPGTVRVGVVECRVVVGGVAGNDIRLFVTCFSVMQIEGRFFGTVGIAVGGLVIGVLASLRKISGVCGMSVGGRYVGRRIQDYCMAGGMECLECLA